MIMRCVTKLIVVFAVVVVGSLSGAAAAEHEVKVKCKWGSIGATLALPDEGADTAVLIVAGSGPTDRNGNSLPVATSYCYKLLSDGLVEQGYAVMRYDKRGIGASVVDVQMIPDVVFRDFVDDAVECVRYLYDEGFERVVIAGHSEGALIALDVAQRDECRVDGLVLLCGAGYPIDVILQRQLAAQLIPSHIGLMVSANNIIRRLKHGERVALEDVPTELVSLFHPSVQPFIISQMLYDPALLAVQCEVPYFVVSGGHDIQVTVDNGEELARGEMCAGHVVFEKMTHVLKDCDTTDRMEQITTIYNNSWSPLSAGLVMSVADFIATI